LVEKNVAFCSLSCFRFLQIFDVKLLYIPGVSGDDEGYELSEEEKELLGED